MSPDRKLLFHRLQVPSWWDPRIPLRDVDTTVGCPLHASPTPFGHRMVVSSQHLHELATSWPSVLAPSQSLQLPSSWIYLNWPVANLKNIELTLQVFKSQLKTHLIPPGLWTITLSGISTSDSRNRILFIMERYTNYILNWIELNWNFHSHEIWFNRLQLVVYPESHRLCIFNPVILSSNPECQCKSERTGVMWQNRGFCATTRARAFWTCQTGACKLIDGCSLELCSVTPSVASSGMHRPQNVKNCPLFLRITLPTTVVCSQRVRVS